MKFFAHITPHYAFLHSSHRDVVQVKCYPDTYVNDYVPFYFGFRTPMLYKIKTGNGVVQRSQEEIIYLCCKVEDFINSDRQWCFTDGNAARSITKFYTDSGDIEKLDFRSIHATEWTDNNSDGDHDRMRKKHAEFLVREHVPVRFIRGVVVFNEMIRQEMEQLIANYQLPIKVGVSEQNKFYYQ